MKIQSQEVDVTMSNDLEEGSFYIQATPEAFEALSGGLYKNRILAPIRELSANAYDSHAEKNLTEPGSLDKPFEVHVPNSFDPTFSIRDYGVGLSEDKVDKVFRGYFNSTKKNSNDFVGCLGLGSKSPFAYVQSFTVKSFYNGKCYIYNCYKNSRNCPSITKMGEIDTTEPNGLHISFPVSSSDFYSFKSEMSRAFAFYKVKPIIVGSDVKINEYNYILSNDKFGILNSSGSSLIVMGNIAYPFETSEFSSSSFRFSEEESKLVNWGVHLFVPIGSVSIASSREALSYTPETMSTIKQHLTLAVDSLKEEVSKKSKNIPTIWEARLYCNSATDNVLNRIIIDSYNKSFTINWNGKQVSDIFNIKTAPSAPTSVMSVSLETSWRRSRSGNEPTLKRFDIESLRASENLIIIVNDMKIGAYAATQRYMSDKGLKKVVLISNDYGKDFLEEFGIPQEQVIFASTLEKAERRPRTVGGVKVSRTMLQEYKSGSFENVEVDLNSESGLYFETKRGEIKIKEEFVPSGIVNKVFKNLNDLGFSQKIYAVRPCDLEKIKSKSNWKLAEPEIVKFINSLTAISNEVAYTKGYESLPEELKEKIKKYSRIKREVKFDTCDSFNTLSTTLEQYNAVKSVSKNYSFRSLINIFELSVKPTTFPDLLACVKDIELKYPLLKYIGSVEYGMTEEKAKDIRNYIFQISGCDSLEEEAVDAA